MTQSTPTFDPGRQRIGSVYAKALIEAAEKVGESDQVVAELEAIVSDVVDRSPQIAAVLSSPRIPHTEKAAMIDKAFGGQVTVTVLNFLKVLSRHGRLDCLHAVVATARKLLNELRGRLEVELRTAAPISNPLKELIASRLRGMLGKDVVLHTKIDAEMLGGVVVRIGDTLYDGSVATRLANMREKAVQQSSAKIRDSLSKFVSIQ